MTRRLANYEPPFTAADLQEQEYDRAAERFVADAFLAGGVWRWRVNDACPFDDLLAAMERRGLVTLDERVQTGLQRQRDTAAFLAEYRRRQPAEPTSEERAEARAAFGSGEEVVDVLSGRRYTT